MAGNIPTTTAITDLVLLLEDGYFIRASSFLLLLGLSISTSTLLGIDSEARSLDSFPI